MTLSALIRKGGLAEVATATPATIATQDINTGGTVAEVATVAVATPLTPLPGIVVLDFDEAKLMRALRRACYGLTITAEQLRGQVDDEFDYAELVTNPTLARCFAESVAYRMPFEWCFESEESR